jgi:hypothetical protein
MEATNVVWLADPGQAILFSWDESSDLARRKYETGNIRKRIRRNEITARIVDDPQVRVVDNVVCHSISGTSAVEADGGTPIDDIQE